MGRSRVMPRVRVEGNAPNITIHLIQRLDEGSLAGHLHARRRNTREFVESRSKLGRLGIVCDGRRRKALEAKLKETLELCTRRRFLDTDTRVHDICAAYQITDLVDIISSGRGTKIVRNNLNLRNVAAEVLTSELECVCVSDHVVRSTGACHGDLIQLLHIGGTRKEQSLNGIREIRRPQRLSVDRVVHGEGIGIRLPCLTRHLIVEFETKVACDLISMS